MPIFFFAKTKTDLTSHFSSVSDSRWKEGTTSSLGWFSCTRGSSARLCLVPGPLLRMQHFTGALAGNERTYYNQLVHWWDPRCRLYPHHNFGRRLRKTRGEKGGREYSGLWQVTFISLRQRFFYPECLTLDWPVILYSGILCILLT